MFVLLTRRRLTNTSTSTSYVNVEAHRCVCYFLMPFTVRQVYIYMEGNSVSMLTHISIKSASRFYIVQETQVAATKFDAIYSIQSSITFNVCFL